MLDLACRIAGMAREGEQIEAFVARGLTTTIKVYDGDVESLTAAESFGVGIRVVVGKRQGFAHCGTLDESVVFETLQEARDNAAFGQPDEFNGVAEPDGVEPVEQDLWREELVRFPIDEKIALALELERRVKGLDPRICGVRNASYGDSIGEGAVANSLGVTGYGRGTVCSVSVSALAEDQGETKIGGGHDADRDPALLNLDKVANDAVERAVRMFGATKPPSQRLSIVLEPRLAAVVLGIVGGMLTGERLLKGRTPFAGREGEQIAAPWITLVDDPTNPASMGADTYDGEGLACRRNVLIENGVLQGFLHNSYTGRRAGVGSTGSAVRGSRSTPSVGCQALAVTPGSASCGELLAGVDQGLYVQSFTGLHSGVNPVSGDFSVGAEGLMIRGGELAEPVRELTLASSIQRLLLDVEAVGADLEWLPGGTGSATLVIGDVQLSGR